MKNGDKMYKDEIDIKIQKNIDELQEKMRAIFWNQSMNNLQEGQPMKNHNYKWDDSIKVLPKPYYMSFPVPVPTRQEPKSNKINQQGE